MLARILNFICSIFVEPKQAQRLFYNLRIGPALDALIPVNDPQGLGGYQLAIEKLLREQDPERIYLLSDDPADLSVVRKALAYLAGCYGELAVCPQLPDSEVAAAYELTIEEYAAIRDDPMGAGLGAMNPV